jgi:hypothetical protein
MPEHKLDPKNAPAVVASDNNNPNRHQANDQYKQKKKKISYEHTSF